MKLKGREWYNKGKWEIHVEYNLLWHAIFCGIEIRLNSTDSDRALTLSFHIPKIIDLWLSIDHPSFSRFMPSERVPSSLPDREYWDRPLKKWIGAKWHHGTFWWSLWEDRDEWSSSQPWWWGGNFTPKDFFLGRSKHTKRDIKTETAVLRMPEGEYSVAVETWESVWTRPRWPISKRTKRAECEFSPPIPIPGKGESSWDIDDDAIHSVTVSEKTLDQALEDIEQSVIERRYRYGGTNWVPDGGWTAE